MTVHFFTMRPSIFSEKTIFFNPTIHFNSWPTTMAFKAAIYHSEWFIWLTWPSTGPRRPGRLKTRDFWRTHPIVVHFSPSGSSILDLTLKSDQKWPLSMVLRSTKPYSHFRRFSYSSLFVFELGQVLRDLLLYKKYIQLSLQKSGLNPTWSSAAHL